MLHNVTASVYLMTKGASNIDKVEIPRNKKIVSLSLVQPIPVLSPFNGTLLILKKRNCYKNILFSVPSMQRNIQDTTLLHYILSGVYSVKALITKNKSWRRKCGTKENAGALEVMSLYKNDTALSEKPKNSLTL